MSFMALVAAGQVSLTVLGTVATFLLLQQGLRAATRPRANRQAIRNLLLTVASIVCLVAAIGILHVISQR